MKLENLLYLLSYLVSSTLFVTLKDKTSCDCDYDYIIICHRSQCFCGDETPNNYDRKPESDCNVNCPGENWTKCGGTWRNAIYATGAGNALFLIYSHLFNFREYSCNLFCLLLMLLYLYH